MNCLLLYVPHVATDDLSVARFVLYIATTESSVATCETYVATCDCNIYTNDILILLHPKEGLKDLEYALLGSFFSCHQPSQHPWG